MPLGVGAGVLEMDVRVVESGPRVAHALEQRMQRRPGHKRRSERDQRGQPGSRRAHGGTTLRDAVVAVKRAYRLCTPSRVRRARAPRRRVRTARTPTPTRRGSRTSAIATATTPATTPAQVRRAIRRPWTPRALVTGEILELEIGPGRGGFVFERVAAEPSIARPSVFRPIRPTISKPSFARPSTVRPRPTVRRPAFRPSRPRPAAHAVFHPARPQIRSRPAPRRPAARPVSRRRR